MKSSSRTFIYAIACLGFIPANAEPSGVEISNSGTMVYDEAQGQLHISGEVNIEQAPFRITADEVWLRQANREIVASGKVRFYYDTRDHELDLPLPPARAGTDFFSDSLSRETSYEREVLRTSRARFFPNDKILRTEGNAEIFFGIARLIGENLHIDLGKSTLEAPRYRMGFDNLFLSGHDLRIAGENIEATNAQFYFGEPEFLSLQGSAGFVSKDQDNIVTMRKVWLKIGRVPVFYLPWFEYNLGHTVINLEAGAGFSGDLGYLVELRPYYSPIGFTRFFSDINYYSRRGTLLGPGLSLDLPDFHGHRIRSTVESGIIRDSGDLGFDLNGSPIDPQRYFVDLSHMHTLPDGSSLNARIQAWGDSEIVRDFHPGRFHTTQQPDSFVELRIPRHSWVFSAFSRFRIEDFEHCTERLPELTLELLPSKLGHTGTYHTLSLQGSRLRDSNPNRETPMEYSRLMATWHAAHPVFPTRWLDFVPSISARSLYFDNRDTELSAFQRHILEAGFDLSVHTLADWEYSNRIWDMHGIRHVFKPTLQYRNHLSTSSSSTDWVPDIDLPLFATGTPDHDLLTSRAYDRHGEFQLLRLGFKNHLLTRSLRHKSTRTLLNFDVFHDFLFPKSGSGNHFSEVTTNLAFRPAHWLQLDLQSRWDSKSLDLEVLFGRLSLINGDLWRMDLSTLFLTSRHEQYRGSFEYKLNEDLRILAAVGYNAHNQQFYEQMIGIQYAIANHWDLLLSVSRREGSTRNEEIRWDIKFVSGRF